MTNSENTIVAISTAFGTGGIGIIRMSGSRSFEIINNIFVPKNKTDKIVGYTMKYGNIIENGEIVDEALVSYFVNPKSYTREDMCEINIHGGNAVIRKILELCVKNGARIAEPGEFTKRAFLNGRIDLSQAEAVIDLINSNTELEARESVLQLKGKLSNQISEIEEILYKVITTIEVSIDYPEYDLEEVDNIDILEELDSARIQINKLIDTFDNGKLIREGIQTVILGRPNAGKSSLMNAILNEDRAIVSSIEGTTRDTIEEFVDVKGIRLKLVDTAGIRETENEIEKIGVNKAMKMAKNAELIIAIFDITNINKQDEELLKFILDKNSIILLNKIDLEKEDIKIKEIFNTIKKPIIKISAKNRKGLDLLYVEIEKMFNLDKIKANQKSIITNERHKVLLELAKKNIEQGIQEIKDNIPADICSVYIKEALENIGEIVGKNVSDEIINQIFKNFCLGK